MSLILYMHPLASFCQKVLIALYENGTSFEAHIVDPAEPAVDLPAPFGKIPVLRDLLRGETIAESSIIIEYLARHYPGACALVPDEPDRAREARLWDRFFDLYVQTPMQKVTTDLLRPPDQRDAFGVAEARAALYTSYGLLERQLARSPWAIGDAFGLADCAAAPALFYAQTAQPFGDEHPRLAAYFTRLAERPSFVRVMDEARPYFPRLPLHHAFPRALARAG